MFLRKFLTIETVLILVIGLLLHPSASEEVDETCEELYQRGVDHYLDEEWSECITNLEAAIAKYKRVLMAIADCRIRCSNENYEYMNPLDIGDLHFYEKMVKKTLCFMKCKRLNYHDVKFDKSPDMNSLKALEDLYPYLYIQTCYLNDKQNQKAASAAFTFLVKHPDEYVSKSNLKYFLTLPGVDQRHVVNYEVEEYYPLYLNAVNSYNDNDWEKVIAYMEEALHAYIAADEKCRVLCEGSFDQGWLPDFTASVSNHFTYCLQCKQGCGFKLKTLDGLMNEELLADFYNYLQIAYYRMKRFAEAFRCVGSFLLINPKDEEMLYNKKLYSDHINDAVFDPRPEIVYYLNRNKYERKLLKFINDEFNFELKQTQSVMSKADSVVVERKSSEAADPNDNNRKSNKVNPFKKYISRSNKINKTF